MPPSYINFSPAAAEGSVPTIPSEPRSNACGWIRELNRRRITEHSIRIIKRNCASYFERTVSGSFPSLILAVQMLDEHPSTGHDEVQQEYLAWRMIWYAYKLNPRDELENELGNIRSIPGVLDALRPLNMWGDILNDHMLFSLGHYTKDDLNELYGLDPEVLEYLLSHSIDWEMEIEFVEGYTGLMYDRLSCESNRFLRRLLAVVNNSGLGLVTAERELIQGSANMTPSRLLEFGRRFRLDFDQFGNYLCYRFRMDEGVYVPPMEDVFNWS
ncbi:uncharacterized protein B0J16DRAFT_413220 [Fusarium flagelliforme]|uniref:Uncharacterized protein n=1 Tax=Fusarium flagelliforme TaxID=2675880 RepID=A0A395MSY4_9HYPO|nr:uncharacterized protein B0J16DRAFT_413220 [Fusarium flagelliforme]KAH7188796.1 hypothetical protein B0J16DRAFT_413220 [Fusarium flagelliforme]RFN50807.1 hypothetical protein FIE12Z_4923 [Fusarium flagelliforme]